MIPFIEHNIYYTSIDARRQMDRQQRLPGGKILDPHDMPPREVGAELIVHPFTARLPPPLYPIGSAGDRGPHCTVRPGGPGGSGAAGGGREGASARES